MKLSRLVLATLAVTVLSACGSDATAPSVERPSAASFDQGTMGTPNVMDTTKTKP